MGNELLLDLWGQNVDGDVPVSRVAGGDGVTQTDAYELQMRINLVGGLGSEALVEH